MESTAGIKIALDAMGGENMPAAAIAGALAAAADGVQVVLVGDETQLRSALASAAASVPAEVSGRVTVQHAPDLITMDEHAADVRRRKDSSVMVAMQLVKEGEAAAAVSMGHSGATMAAALLVLGRIPGVERPAILVNVPTDNGYSALLDAGANTDVKPTYLQQFAVMGSAFVGAVWDKRDPTVGLLSIGEEPHKGNEVTKAAHELLAATPGIRFHGNIEGGDVFAGTTDVIVTDGFTGNIVLKLAEGEAKVLFGWIRRALKSSLRARLGGLLARPALRAIAERMDPAEYGAQPLLGIDGYAFIGHGSADAKAVASALRVARRAVESSALERTRQAMMQ